MAESKGTFPIFLSPGKLHIPSPYRKDVPAYTLSDKLHERHFAHTSQRYQKKTQLSTWPMKHLPGLGPTCLFSISAGWPLSLPSFLAGHGPYIHYPLPWNAPLCLLRILQISATHHFFSEFFNPWALGAQCPVLWLEGLFDKCLYLGWTLNSTRTGTMSDHHSIPWAGRSNWSTGETNMFTGWLNRSQTNSSFPSLHFSSCAHFWVRISTLDETHQFLGETRYCFLCQIVSHGYRNSTFLSKLLLKSFPSLKCPLLLPLPHEVLFSLWNTLQLF